MKISILTLKNLASVAGFQYKKEEGHFNFAFPAKVTTDFPESDAPRLKVEPLVFHINPEDWPYFVVDYSDIFSIQSCSQELEMAHERISKSTYSVKVTLRDTTKNSKSWKNSAGSGCQRDL